MSTFDAECMSAIGTADIQQKVDKQGRLCVLCDVELAPPGARSKGDDRQFFSDERKDKYI